MKQTTATQAKNKKTSNSSGSAQNRLGSKQQSGNSGKQQPNGGRQDAGSRDNNGDTRRAQTDRTGSQKSNTGQSTKIGDSLLEKFFMDQLKDIYYAEQKITQSLPKMREAATTEELKEAFEDHLHQTQRHVKRLEKVFETLGQRAEGKKCEAIEGISKEVESIIGETEAGSMTRDAALIIAAQKVEHYEIATYGGLVQLAITMQLHDAADLLDKTLIEEEDTDARLTEIAENEINLRAEHEGSNAEHFDQQEEDDDENDADKNRSGIDDEQDSETEL
jgi:ferritin-like metal-binding protein YciE